MQSTPAVKAFYGDYPVWRHSFRDSALLAPLFYPESIRTKGYTWWRAIWRFYLRLIVGVLPAVVFGLAFNDLIEENLGSVRLVAVMLIVGGIFMLFADSCLAMGGKKSRHAKNAFLIGLFQCLAMIPGVSPFDGNHSWRYATTSDA